MPALILAVLTMESATHAQEVTVISTSPGRGWLKTSGADGGEGRIIMAPKDHVLAAIVFGESAGVPCYLKPVFWSRVRLGSDPKSSTTGSTPESPPPLSEVSIVDAEDASTCPGPPASRRTASIPDYLGSAAGVDAIRICTSGADGRLRGITLFGARLEEDGGHRDHGDISDTVQRESCDDQQRKISCPRGEVITGLRIEFNQTSGMATGAPDTKAITGLTPYCSEVRHTVLR
jgi:hypothetical protein